MHNILKSEKWRVESGEFLSCKVTLLALHSKLSTPRLKGAF
jgi:hypothetical protein